MSCRRNTEQSGSLGKKRLSNRMITGALSLGICCFFSTSFAHNNGSIHRHQVFVPKPLNAKAGPLRLSKPQLRNNIRYYGYGLLPTYQIAPPMTVVPPPAPVKQTPKPAPPKRSDFVKDELLLVYDFGMTRQQVEAVTKKYNLKRKGGMAIGALRKSVVVADTQGQNPLELQDIINKAQKQFSATTNNFFTLAANTVATPTLNYPLAQTGIGRAQTISRGRGVVIGLVDTPVDRNHPTLRGSNIEQHVIVDPKTVESKVHGTSIAGILVSKNPQIGVAPEAKLLSVSAFSSQPGHPKNLRGTSADIVAAIAYCIERNVDVLNLSFTGGRDKFVEQIVRAAVRRNITVVAAGGNKGRIGSSVYPAVIDGVVGVTAVDRHQRLFKFADRGRFIDIAAPGVGVLTTAPNGKYQISTGTSMAAAHISGVMALLKSYRRGYSPNQLSRTAYDLGRRGRDDAFGHGLVNASAALRELGAPLPY